MATKKPAPKANDQRSNVKNDNNKAKKADLDNRSVTISDYTDPPISE